MKNTAAVRLRDTRSILIQVEGDSADDVNNGFIAALKRAGEAMKLGQRVDETHLYKTAKVSVVVEPNSKRAR